MMKQIAEYWKRSFSSIGAARLVILAVITAIGFLFFGFREGHVIKAVESLENSGNHTLAISYWAKTYKIDYIQHIVLIEQTSDAGFIAQGEISDLGYSHNSDWIVKFDSAGAVQWEKQIGWNNDDNINSIRQTSDGGYIAAGSTSSYGAGSEDVLVIKLDASGNILWQKVYGDAYFQNAVSIRQTSDSGFAVLIGPLDFEIMKLDASGAMEWNRRYGGGNNTDSPADIQQTSDNGFIVGGYTNSFGAGGKDIWIVKLDSSGNIEWQKTYGGTADEELHSLKQLSGGDYIFAGYSKSFGAGWEDFLVVRLDASGNIIWQKTYGGAWTDIARSIWGTSDGGFVVAGQTESFGSGYTDGWILKLDGSGNIVWQKAYGMADSDSFFSAGRTSDGGVIASGSVNNGYGWAVKVDGLGEIDAECSIYQDTSVSGADCPATVTDTSVTPQSSSWSSEDSFVAFEACSATVSVQCWNELPPCPALECGSISVADNPGCQGIEQQFTALYTGGEGAITVEWDWTDDGTYDNTGNPACHTYPSAGTYTARARLTDSCIVPGTQSCTMTIPVTVNANPSPSITPDPAAFCEGSSLILDAGGGYSSYQWSTGETTRTITVDKAGSYGVTVIDSGGCQGYDEIEVSVNPNPTPTITESACEGKNVVLDAGAGYASYLWSNNETTRTITVPGDGTTYSVTVTDSNGCEGWDDHTTQSCISTWAKAYGFLSEESVEYALQVSDGGFIIVGYTNYYDTMNGDPFVLKLNRSGAIQWQRTLNVTGIDDIKSVFETSDGGFIISGQTSSFGAGNSDFWVLKYDGSGNIQWQKTYGGSYSDMAYSICQTLDYGYLVAGRTYSFIDTSYGDAWVLKLDALGNIQWQKSYGGSGSDIAFSVAETETGEIFVAGRTSSFGTGGNADIFALKLEANGSMIWKKRYGAAGFEDARMARPTFDGGFIVAGLTDSSGAGSYDYIVMKLDGSGGIEWQKTFGEGNNDQAYSVRQTQDGGFILAGITTGTASDSAVIKLDHLGNIQWQKKYGGGGDECANSIEQTSDGGFVVGGKTNSFGSGGNDLWVLKTNSLGEIDSSCTFINNSSMVSSSSTAVATDINVSICESTAVVSDTTVSAEDTEGATSEQCSGVPSCPLLSCLSIDVLPNPGCDGESQYFTANYTGGDGTVTVEWDWTDDGIYDETGNFAVHTYPSAGNYSVRARLSDSCADPGLQICTVSVPVTVNVTPVPAITPDPAEFCEGGNIVLDAGEGYSSYLWSTGETTRTITVTVGGLYSVTVTNTHGCEGFDEITVTEHASPAPEITGPSVICQGAPAQLDAGAGYSSYLWSPGGQTTQVIDVSPAATTSYSVIVTDANDCSGTDDHTLTVYPNPTPTIAGPSLYCVGNPAITLDAGTGYSSYLWSPGGETAQTINITPAVTTIYSVAVTDGNGCQGSDDHTVTVSQIPDLPADFSVTPECGKIVLSWSDGLHETQYLIERDSGSGFSILINLPANTTSYDDTAVSDGINYIYRMRAENSCGNSGYTAELSAATNTAIYSATTLSENTAYCNSLVFTWDDTYAAETAYVVEREVNSSGVWEMIEILPPDTVLFGDHDVEEGSNYSYRVVVRNRCGDSTASNVITMTPDCSVVGATCLDPYVLSVDENISFAPDWVESASIAWNGTHFGIVWSDPRDGGKWKIIFAKMDVYGDLVTGSEKIIGDGPLENPDIAWNGSQFGVAASGNIACGEGGEHIYFFTLDIDGNLTSSQSVLSCGWGLGNNFNPKVHWNGSTWGVVWESWASGNEEVLFQRLDTLGVPQHATPLQISSSGAGLWSGNPDITSLNGEWFIVWEEEDATDSEIHYSRRNADGTAVSSAALTSDSVRNWFGRIAANDSLIGLTYIVETEPYFRAFNPDGSWATSLQKLDTTPDCKATDISTTGSEWAAVWQKASVLDDPPDIDFQRIDGAGTPVGSPINVTNNAWDSWGPKICWADDRWGLAYTENVNWGNSDAYGAVVQCGSVGGVKPPAPRDLVAQGYCSLITLFWIDTSPNEDSFTLERNVNGAGFTTLAILDPNSHFYFDTDVTASNTYAYRVKASNTYGDSGYSNESPALSPDDCPITDIFIKSVTYNPDGTITFVWTDIVWQEYVDIYRGLLNGDFNVYDTIVDCTWDAETGTYTTTVSQEGADFYYYIAPKINEGNFFGYDSEGKERTPTGPLCP